MRTLFLVVLLLVVLGAGVYFALPILIEREIAGFREDFRSVKQKVEKLEEFVRAEEEARKMTQIKPGADSGAVIRGVNALSTRVISLERSFTREMAEADKANRELKSSTAATLKKQAEALEKESSEIHAQISEVTYKAIIAQIRGHLLKVKTDLLAKNIGIADAEIEVVVGLLEKAKRTVSPEAIKSLETFQATLRKARGEVATDLPAAMKRIDLLWHELGR